MKKYHLTEKAKRMFIQSIENTFSEFIQHSSKFKEGVVNSAEWSVNLTPLDFEEIAQKEWHSYPAEKPSVNDAGVIFLIRYPNKHGVFLCRWNGEAFYEKDVPQFEWKERT